MLHINDNLKEQKQTLFYFVLNISLSNALY